MGDTFMKVIETCRANGVNSLDYVFGVVRNEAAVRADPDRWMPWNYRQADPPPPPP